jgi:hypothetical protein
MQQQEDILKFLTWQQAHLENDIQPLPDAVEKHARADTAVIEAFKITKGLLPEPVQIEIEKILALHTEMWKPISTESEQ